MAHTTVTDVLPYGDRMPRAGPCVLVESQGLATSDRTTDLPTGSEQTDPRPTRQRVRLCGILGDGLTDRRNNILTPLIADFETSLTRYLSYAHQTLIHRDAHHWNFLYPKNSEGTTKLFD